MASQNGNVSTVQLLVEAGASLDVQRNVSHYTLHTDYQLYSLCDRVRSNAVICNVYFRALTLMAIQNCTDIVALCVRMRTYNVLIITFTGSFLLRHSRLLV